jgi:lysozyme
VENELIEALRREEGERLSAYSDSLGLLTIGVGRLIDARKGGGITREESAYLLNNDIQRATRAVKERWPAIWHGLNEPRRGVLVMMVFQLGIEGLASFQAMLHALRAGDYREASVEMMNSVWSLQTPERARRMRDQMASGEWWRKA